MLVYISSPILQHICLIDEITRFTYLLSDENVTVNLMNTSCLINMLQNNCIIGNNNWGKINIFDNALFELIDFPTFNYNSTK